jgi:hypothetical protein
MLCSALVLGGRVEGTNPKRIVLPTLEKQGTGSSSGYLTRKNSKLDRFYVCYVVDDSGVV